MPRYRAKSEDFFIRDHERVMAHCDGRAVLTNKNKIGNPDLKDFRPDDSLQCWELDSPHRPTGWNVYVRKQGQPRFNKQNTHPLSLENGRYYLSDKIEVGRNMPDRNKVSDTAGPEFIRCKRRNRPGAVGFHAGQIYVAYAWVTGEHPNNSKQLTPTSQPFIMNIGQGQRLEVPLPQDVPEGVSGIAVYVGYSPVLMYEQRRVDVRFRVPPSVMLRGPFRSHAKLRNNVTFPNTTRLGRPEAPAVDNDNSERDTQVQETEVAHRHVTRNGRGPRSQSNNVSISQTQNGERITYEPKSYPDGVIGWIPEFKGSDGQWYRIQGPDGGEDGLPRGKKATLHTNSANKEDWKGREEPVPTDDDPDTDETGVEPPDSPTDPPTLHGDLSISPGKYFICTTFQVGNKESAPSPVKEIELPEMGNTGVTDDMIVVFKPTIQQVTNARFTDQDKDGVQLDWEEPEPHGTEVTMGEGRLTINDNTNSTNDVIVRISDIQPIISGRMWTFRSVVNVTRYVAGAAKVQIRWYNDLGTELRQDTVLSKREAGKTEIRRTLGPGGRGADIRIPENATQFRIAFISSGQGTQRNLSWYIEHIGLHLGAHPRKRWPLHLGLYDDKVDPHKKTDKNEPPELHYPPGAYCRVVDDPDDGPGIFFEDNIDEVRFETGGVAGPFFPHSAGGGSVNVNRDAAINGDFGAELDITSGGGQACIRRDGFSKSNVSIGAFFRMRDLTARPLTLLEASNGAGWVAQIECDSAGNLIVRGRNGAGTSTVMLAKEFDDIRRRKLEMLVENVGSLNGKISLFISRDDDPIQKVELQSLDWSGQANINRVDAGLVQSPGQAKADVDDVFWTNNGQRQETKLETNYVEYWAPEGSGYDFNHFMTGMKVPVKGGRTYTFSAYVGSENVQKKADLFIAVIRNENGRVIKKLDPLTSVKGDEYWRRHKMVIDVPDNGSVIHFIGNNVADGLIRAGALQVEPGDTMTAWDNTNAMDGYFTVAFDTKLPGGAIAEGMMDRVTEWVRGRAIVRHQKNDAGNIVTDVQLDWRSGWTMEELESNPWRPSLANLMQHEGMRQFAEIKVNMSTTDNTKSPEVRGVFLDTKRPLPMLYKRNGDDFTSGVLVRDLPAPAPERNVLEREYASGELGFAEVGRGRPMVWLRGFEIEASRDSVAEEIRDMVGKGDGTFIIEARNKRYVVRFFNVNFTVNRQNHKKRGLGTDKDGYWRHIADGIEAYILEYEDF